MFSNTGYFGLIKISQRLNWRSFKSLQKIRSNNQSRKLKVVHRYVKPSSLYLEKVSFFFYFRCSMRNSSWWQWMTCVESMSQKALVNPSCVTETVQGSFRLSGVSKMGSPSPPHQVRPHTCIVVRTCYDRLNSSDVCSGALNSLYFLHFNVVVKIV